MVFSLAWLPAILEDAGLKVAEVPDWRTRGRGDVARIRGVICHHTASSREGNMPSLNLLVKGRPDLQGPLAQLGLGRDGTYYVIAAGRANHAGPGVWRGIQAGNSSFIGIEAENGGTAADHWPDVQLDAYRRGIAAILRQIGADAQMVCGHREYATPKGRKIDPLFDMAEFREGVAALLQGRAPPPRVVPAMDARQRPTLRRGSKGSLVALVQRLVGAKDDGDFGGDTEALVRAFQRARSTAASTLVADGIVGPRTWDAFDQATANATRTAAADAASGVALPATPPAVAPGPILVIPAAATCAAVVPAPAGAVLPPVAEDATRQVFVRSGKAIAPDGTVFASSHGPGFQTAGVTTIKAWIGSGGSSTDLSPSIQRALSAISDNEGRFEAINSYDKANLSFGIMQWTAGVGSANGELASLLARLKSRAPAVFQDCFGRFGLDCRVRPGSTTGVLVIDGHDLADDQRKSVLRGATWAYRFWRAGHIPEVRDVQLEHAGGRVDLFIDVLVHGHPIGAWMTSELSVAQLLDQHVNRPSEVRTVLDASLGTLLAAKTCGPDPARWNDRDEATLLETYLARRQATKMTSSKARGEHLMALAASGALSAARHSFARTA